MDQKLRDAIQCRLQFRHEFLCALDEDLEILDTRSSENFVSCLSSLNRLSESVSLGQPVPEAFSLKIQRRLASTVPPRPIVHISAEDALVHLKRLCQDAIDMQEMMDYRGPSNFKVSHDCHFFVNTLSEVPNACSDRDMDSAITEAPAFSLHPLSPAGTDYE